MSLNGQTAVILGGSGGIGMVICRDLLKEDVKSLYIVDLPNGSKALETLSKEFPAKSTTIFFEPCDVTDAKLLKSIFLRISEKEKYIDILVNSAGIVRERDVAQTVAVNLTSVINSTLLGVEVMSKHKTGRGGSIINIASCTGIDPVCYIAVYSATKFGVVGFTKALASEQTLFKLSGIRFLTICPGGTDTTLLSSIVNEALFPELDTEMRKFLSEFPVQSTSVVSDCVMRAIKEGENGSVWSCYDGEIKTI